MQLLHVLSMCLIHSYKVHVQIHTVKWLYVSSKLGDIHLLFVSSPESDGEEVITVAIQGSICTFEHMKVLKCLTCIQLSGNEY